MNYRPFISFGSLIIILLTSLTVGPGCANIIPPQGGPRDTIPPRLMKATPVNSSTNFTGNKIIFSFDEYVDLQNVQENLLVSPNPRLVPSVDFKLKTVTVKLKDTLEPNTTYTLNFGSSIKDYAEGNVLKEFTYTFSTGRYIDSLELRGKVVLAETGKADSTLVVILHTSANDSAVVKDKPRYIAKVDGKGNFLFKNLPPRKFYLYALKDEGGARRYFSDKQLFAFAGEPIVVQSKNDPITLYAYAAKPGTPAPVISSLNVGSRNKVTGGNVEKRLRYQTNLVNSQQDLLSNFNISFEQPLRSFDSSKIRLYTDSAFKPVANYQFVKDSSNRKLQMDINWKENTLYRIILDKDFAEDSLGRKLLKTDTLSFRTKSLASYGALKLKFHNLDLAKHPVLLFVTNEIIYKSFVLTSTDFSQALFLPGEYELRILYDDNQNGVWDPGQFFGRHKQPEIVRPIERHISVKPSWQNEFDLEASGK